MTLLLNDDQERAVKHIGSPLLIVAGPGSGKTRVIVERILYFIQNGVKPSEILCLTFSNKAAEEMKQRLEKIIEISDMQISTIHSFARDLLLDNVLVSGVGLSKGIMSRQSQLVWGLKNIDTFNLQFIEIGNNAVEIIESIIDGISSFKNELVSCKDLNSYLDEKLSQDLDDESRSFFLKLADLAKVYEKFQVFQRSKSVVDFDDLIIEAVNLLKKRKNVAKKYQDRFKHIFVDEFQDNNFAQLEFVKLLSQNGNVTAVGDDDQCIYKFQGAYLTIFKDFFSFFDNTKVITLNQNYRSTQNIVKVASQLFNEVSERQSKQLYSQNERGEKIYTTSCPSETSEVDFVVNTIRNLIGKPIIRRDNTTHLLTYRDFAILSRKKSLGQKFTNGLKTHGIPVVSLGESNLFANPIVKDFIGFLKITSDPGRSGIEITKLMIHAGVSERNIAEINRIAKKKAYADPTDIDFVYDTLKNYSSLKITQLHIIEELKNQVEKLVKIGNTLSLSELIYTILVSISGLYKQSIISNTPSDRRNRLILKELNKISLEFESLNPHANVSDFISHLSLMGEFEIEIEEGNETDDAVWVTTIHQSKGKEFPMVFVVDVATDRLPLRYQAKKFYVPADLSKGVKITEDEKELYNQEERRLFYVAMTRAQNRLFITYAKKYGDNIRETKPSRFLKEIHFDNNPLIKFEEFTGENTNSQSFIVVDRIEKIKTDLQLKATNAITQMNLKTAVEKIIALSKLKYYEENNTFEGFDPGSVIKLNYTDNFLNDALDYTPVSLINKDTLKLSVSKLDTYKDCPLKFKFTHVLEIPSAPRSFFDLGTSVHSVVEHLTKLEKDGVEITENIALEILDKEWITYSFKTETEATQSKAKAVNMIRTYLNWNSNNRNTPLEAEKKFSVEISDIAFHGSIDRVEITPEGEFEVIDFKTGSIYESKNTIRDNFQMNVYALATEKLYGKLPKSTSLFYLKKNKIIVNPIDSSYLNKVIEILENMTKSILEEDFKPNPNFETCRLCDYQSICDSKKIK